jgi:hypothetical protein
MKQHISFFLIFRTFYILLLRITSMVPRPPFSSSLSHFFYKSSAILVWVWHKGGKFAMRRLFRSRTIAPFFYVWYRADIFRKNWRAVSIFSLPARLMKVWTISCTINFACDLSHWDFMLLKYFLKAINICSDSGSIQITLPPQLLVTTLLLAHRAWWTAVRSLRQLVAFGLWQCGGRHAIATLPQTQLIIAGHGHLTPEGQDSPQRGLS